MRIGYCVFTALVAIGLTACGGDTGTGDGGPSLTRVEPSTVTGTVWGEVLDAATQTPLEGATVRLAISGAALEATTDTTGSFAFTEVPAGGQAGVTISKEGYTRATVTAFVPGSTGDFPTDGIGAFVGPIALFALTGSFEVQVVGYDGVSIDGASGQASVMASHVNFGGFGSQPTGLVTTTGTSATGVMRFTGLPDLSALATYGAEFDVTVEPVDANGDGIVDYLGQAHRPSAQWLLTNGARFTITLDPPGGNTSLAPIASNVGSLLRGQPPRPGDSVVGLNGPVRVVYNQPVNPATLLASIFDEEGEVLVPSTPAVEQGNVVSVTPNAPFTEGREYHILIEVLAVGTEGGSNRSRLAGAFFSTPPADEVRVGTNYVLEDLNISGNLNAGDRVTLTLSQAIGLGNGRSSWFPAYINNDLDGSGTVGDFPGEWGSGDPIVAGSLEPNPPSPFAPSGFTRRFRFTMPAANPLSPYAFSPNTTVPVVLNFGGNEPGYERLTDPRGLPISTPSSVEAITVVF